MRKIVISSMIGNGLEWYDYALYAQFATIISQQFFPKSELSDILTFLVFSLGFIIRPIGGVVFGNIGDKFGRRAALAFSILTMAIPTAGIGLLPSYNTIGIAAPLILSILRLIQGFSLGGEFSGCIAYVVEHAPLHKRGLAGSVSFISMCAGMLLGSLVATCTINAFTQEALMSWGWRIPFIMGLFIGLIGFYIRSRLTESPIYKAAKESGMLSRNPVRDVIQQHWRKILMCICIYMTVTAPFYTITVYIETFLKTIGYDNTTSSLVGTIGLIVMIIILPISAYVSDKIGRRPVLLCGSILIVCAIYPLFSTFKHLNATSAFITQIILTIILSIYMGPVPTVLVEMFPTKVRFTGVALSYNISAAIFGGTAPVIAILLSRSTGNKYAISWYLSLLALITTIAIYAFFKETYHKRIK